MHNNYIDVIGIHIFNYPRILIYCVVIKAI